MADRYVFSIHSNTKWGIDVGISFFTCWCPDEASALRIFAIVNQYLPNYAKCSLSRVIREAGNYEIPNSGATITDVNVVTAMFCNSTNGAIRRSLKIPFGYIVNGQTAQTVGVDQVMTVISQNMCDNAGNPLDQIVGYTYAPKNVVQGGPVLPTNSTAITGQSEPEEDPSSESGGE